MRKDPLLKPVKKHHIQWLRNIQTSIDMKCAFDYVDITPKRVDILVDMGLIEFIGGIYQLTEKGRAQLIIKKCHHDGSISRPLVKIAGKWYCGYCNK